MPKGKGKRGEGGGHGPLDYSKILHPSYIFGKINKLNKNFNNGPLKFLLKTCNACI